MPQTIKAEQLQVGHKVVEQRRRPSGFVDVELTVTRVVVGRFVDFWLDERASHGDWVSRTYDRSMDVTVTS